MNEKILSAEKYLTNFYETEFKYNGIVYLNNELNYKFSPTNKQYVTMSLTDEEIKGICE